MKSYLSLLTFILITGNPCFSQKIYSALELNDNKPEEVLYIFLTGDDKLIDELIPQHYRAFGTFDDNTLNIDKATDIHPNLASVDMITSHEKNHTKLSYFFFDDNNKSLAMEDLNARASESFIFDFYNNLIIAREKELIEEDTKEAEQAFNKAEKEVKRLKKSIERNLKDQEKLGKRLEASPEQLANLIEEKNNVLESQLALESSENEDVSENLEELDKKVEKTEKAILKKKKQSGKDSNKLEKKEEQLEKLSSELKEAQNQKSMLDKILQRKKMLVLKN